MDNLILSMVTSSLSMDDTLGGTRIRPRLHLLDKPKRWVLLAPASPASPPPNWKPTQWVLLASASLASAPPNLLVLYRLMACQPCPVAALLPTWQWDNPKKQIDKKISFTFLASWRTQGKKWRMSTLKKNHTAIKSWQMNNIITN